METRNPDPVALLETLDADAIREKLADLESQERQLKALLRAATVRDKEGKGRHRREAAAR